MDLKIREAILLLLADRVPNYVRKEIIISRLKQFDSNEVRKAIDDLIQEQGTPVMGMKGGADPFCALKLTNDKDIPVRKYINVGDVEVPRILTSDSALMSLEDINNAIESLSEYNKVLSSKFKVEMEKATERYWGSIIGLFGLFVALFSLINLAVPKKELPASYSFRESLLAGIAQSVPIALILGIFVLVLVLLFRRK
jgi:hypothetical protein